MLVGRAKRERCWDGRIPVVLNPDYQIDHYRIDEGLAYLWQSAFKSSCVTYEISSVYQFTVQESELERRGLGSSIPTLHQSQSVLKGKSEAIWLRMGRWLLDLRPPTRRTIHYLLRTYGSLSTSNLTSTCLVCAPECLPASCIPNLPTSPTPHPTSTAPPRLSRPSTFSVSTRAPSHSFDTRRYGFGCLVIDSSTPKRLGLGYGGTGHQTSTCSPNLDERIGLTVCAVRQSTSSCIQRGVAFKVAAR